MGDASGSGDGHHVAVAEDPSQGYLRRRRAQTRCDLPELQVAEQPSLFDGAVRHDRYALAREPRQQVVLRAPPGQVVEHLVGRTGRAPGGNEFLQVRCVEITHAPAPDFACGH